MSAITIEEALKKHDRRLYSQKLKDEIVTAFSSNLAMYISRSEQAVENGETEEHLKNITNDFLRGSFYHDAIYEINTDGRIDSSIKVNGEIRVLIEAKNPRNKSEMVSEAEINVKALHEIVFYYLRVTRDTSGEKVRRKPDVELRRCIINDNSKFAIIDANEIEKLVDGYLEKHFYEYQNRQLIYFNNTDKFYEDTKQYFESK